MTENNKKKEEEIKSANQNSDKEKNTEEKLKEVEDKLLRSLAEIENQRRRFEKENKRCFRIWFI